MLQIGTLFTDDVVHNGWLNHVGQSVRAQKINVVGFESVFGNVGGNVTFSAVGDIVAGNKIVTTTIQISVEAVTQRP